MRVYFNRKETPEKASSIDFGAGTVEICCRNVGLYGVVGVTGRSGDERGPEPDHDTPRAWIELRAVNVRLDPDGWVGLRPKTLE